VITWEHALISLDVQLSSPLSSTAHLDLGSELQFLSVVEVSRIPLCLAAGPPCSVYTASGRTGQWFNDILLSSTQQTEEIDDRHQEWWRSDLRQSVLGILTKVIEISDTSGTIRGITEVLFYGVVERPEAQSSPPTPPPSSPHSNAIDVSASTTNQHYIRVQAIPLSSHILTHIPSPPQSPGRLASARDDAQFLPSIEELKSATEKNEAKRKRVFDVFDEAEESRRKARRKGGHGVAAAASKIDEINTLVGQKKTKNPVKPKGNADTSDTGRTAESQSSRSRLGESNPGSPIEGPSHRPLSRSPSISLSRKGTLEGIKRSSLSHITSVNEAGTIEGRNKETISRFVMAGMRLYGLQQRKKQGHSRRDSQSLPTAAVPINSEDAANDENYKLVYHQTYKGVVFAFVSILHLLSC
jgi:hypothetical protein